MKEINEGKNLGEVGVNIPTPEYPFVVGISGKSGVGKTSIVVPNLKSRLEEDGYTIFTMGFADALREETFNRLFRQLSVIKEGLEVINSDFNPHFLKLQEVKQSLVKEGEYAGKTVREAMILIANLLKKEDEFYFVKKLFDKIRSINIDCDPIVIIDDLRFRHEFNSLRGTFNNYLIRVCNGRARYNEDKSETDLDYYEHTNKFDISCYTRFSEVNMYENEEFKLFQEATLLDNAYYGILNNLEELNYYGTTR